MDPEDDQPEDQEGEVMDFEPTASAVEDTDDGGAIVTLDDKEHEQVDNGFLDNLAETIPEDKLKTLASQFLELIERDKEARKKRDQQYEDGIRRTGLGNDAPGGAQFQGASKVVHPLLTEACVDFASRAVKELLPPGGPAKDFIPGTVTQDKIKKAKRKTAFMNWQLTVQSQEFRSEFEQLLTQVPLGGVQYLKLTWNRSRNRPGFLFVPIDDVFIPFAASNFYSAERKTHRQYLTQLDYDMRVKNGMYRDVSLVGTTVNIDQSGAAIANDKVEGRESSAFNEDGLREVFEVNAIVDLDGDDKADGPAPYILTIDKDSSNVLSIYRNWDEEDETYEELQWMVEFPFVPWRGAYAIGLPHMIGGLSAATTGALRALMDSAHISNSQTMLKLKGGSRGGQSLTVEPTQVAEIEGGINNDDIRKLAMPLPFNQPSSVLFQLLQFLVDAGKGVVRTTMDDVSDGNANVPVGTTMAKIEQGMVVFSAIHMRLHAAMGRMLTILHRLNGMYLDDDAEIKEVGEEIARREDFQGPMDVVPVSDPNIFSEAQRFAQIQAISQRSAALPQLYDARKVEERILETLKIPNVKDLLVPAMSPKEQNAVTENVTATMGKPIVAFPEQDHIAHLKTHLAYLVSPTLGSSRLFAPKLIPIMLNHIKEHIALWYASQVFELSNEASGHDIGDALKTMKDPEEKRSFDRMLAESSLNVVASAGEAFAELPAAVDQAIQLLSQMSPPPQPDPAIVIAQNETQRRAMADQAKAELAQKKLEADIMLEKERQRHEDERNRLEVEGRIAANTQDNETATKLTLLGFEHGGPTGAHAPANPNPNPMP